MLARRARLRAPASQLLERARARARAPPAARRSRARSPARARARSRPAAPPSAAIAARSPALPGRARGRSPARLARSARAHRARLAARARTRSIRGLERLRARADLLARAAPAARARSAPRRRAARARRGARRARPARARPRRAARSSPAARASISRARSRAPARRAPRRRASSAPRARAAPRAPAPSAPRSIWRSRRSCSSAASAWRFSGRSRRARLALDVERAVEVLLRALELQLRAAAALAVLAEPGRLLDQQPPVARLGGHDRVHAALRDDRVGLLAEARVGEHLDHVGQPAAGAVEPVAALAVAVQPAHDRDLAQRQVDARRRSCRARSPPRPRCAAARPGRRRRSRPASTAPRTASGDCSPIAHSTASVTLDLPEPLGPTTTLTPGPKSRRVRSGNDLKPFSVSDFRRTPAPSPGSLAGQSLDGHARGLLLGVLLAAAAAAAQLSPVDARGDRVGALVRRARPRPRSRS